MFAIQLKLGCSSLSTHYSDGDILSQGVGGLMGKGVTIYSVHTII